MIALQGFAGLLQTARQTDTHFQGPTAAGMMAQGAGDSSAEANQHGLTGSRRFERCVEICPSPNVVVRNFQGVCIGSFSISWLVAN